MYSSHLSSALTALFSCIRPYEFVCQTVEDKAVLLKIFRSISIGSYTVANLTHEDLSVIPFWPAFAVFSGPMDKKGELGWDKRHVGKNAREISMPNLALPLTFLLFSFPLFTSLFFFDSAHADAHLCVPAEREQEPSERDHTLGDDR